ncbi:uncharacterized protein M6D78_003155 [Vipera latastei]
MDERQKLLGVLEELSDKELKTFVFFLPDAIPGGKRDTDSRVDLAKLILRYYPERALDVLADVLNRVPRKDLVLQLQGEAKGRGSHRDGTEEEREAAAAAAAPPKLVSQEQLMKLARKMGKNWKEIGILFLRMDISRLEQFQEEHSKNIVMQIFSMLWAWRTREKDKATADRLYNILSQEGVELDSSAYAFLLE